jgi:chorismate mutase / prephenate dehydratase
MVEDHFYSGERRQSTNLCDVEAGAKDRNGLGMALAQQAPLRINQHMSARKPVKSPAVVAYLGPEGTFSHLVAHRRHPAASGLPCATITEVFHAVSSGEATLGIVPIENSSGGTITETVDLLIESAGHIHIAEELALDVRLALLGRAGTPLGKIRSVHSHIMPLRHHRDWLRENLPGVSLVESSSTAEAARKVAGSSSAAALAAPGAAALYGLSILKFPVRPEAVNVTHFFVISARSPKVSGTKRCKTAIVAALPQTSGSLHRFLGPFARAGVNLCRIVSRPVPGQPETYVFYLEVEGAANDAQVMKALAGARCLAVRVELPGSYPTRPRYRSVR